MTRWTFVGKVMSLLFNMLSRLVITFLPRSKRLLISWLQLPSAVILELKKIKSVTVSIVSPIYFPRSVNKIDSYNRGGENPKESTSQTIRIINVFLQSLSESFSLLGVIVHLTSLGCCPTLC